MRKNIIKTIHYHDHTNKTDYRSLGLQVMLVTRDISVK
jgi:hypothetical protein